MESLFSIIPEHLERLSPEGAVDLFRELLWGEATRKGIRIAKIRVSHWIYHNDGGVDAIVDNDAAAGKDDLVRVGKTSYQIKAGAAYEPWQDSEIRATLFGKKPSLKENLADRVKACLDQNGTYIIACFKSKFTEQTYNQALCGFRHYFEQMGYKDAKVDLFTQDQIIGFLRSFPSLSLRVTNRDRLKFRSHSSWSRDDTIAPDFKNGDRQEQFIQNIRQSLRTHAESVHVRVLGEAGIGKTRLVFEATNAEDLRPLILYCTASQFRDSDLLNELLREDNSFQVILVVDECSQEDSSDLCNKLKRLGPRLKMVSIHHEFEYTSGNTKFPDVPPLFQNQIADIIQDYGIQDIEAQRWAEYCGGSPRVAHVMGLNLRENPDDLLRPPDTTRVWERFIAGGLDQHSPEVEDRRVLLQHLALFPKFGFVAAIADEARIISKLIEAASPRITWQRFQQIIELLRRDKILQGEYVLYITPKALQIKLWADWWDTYGPCFELNDMEKKLSPTLMDGFFSMCRYAKESQAASRTVKRLLGKDGPFQRTDYLETKLGANFFLALTEADPAAAMVCLNQTIGQWDREQLLKIHAGRWHIVHALEMIAVWREHFHDAARLLLKLAEAENEEGWADNATGVFVGLFSPGPGRVAPTELPPQQRITILKEALESAIPARRAVALRACGEALHYGSFTRRAGPEHQGLRSVAKLWEPKTYGEWWDAYLAVWELVRGNLGNLPPDDRGAAARTLLNHSRGLVRILTLSRIVIDTLRDIATTNLVRKKEVLSEVVEILHYDSDDLPAATVEKLQELSQELTGNNFSSLMRRYVGMELLEDRYDKKGKLVDSVKTTLETLASQAIEDTEKLTRELPWLVTAEAENGYRFGYELALKDVTFSLISYLLEAQAKAGPTEHVFFVGGYFKGLFEKNPERWESVLDILARGEPLERGLVLELSWRSGGSDRAARRILTLAKDGDIPVKDLWLLGTGGFINRISESVLSEWVDFLLRNQEPFAIRLTLDFWYHFYTDKRRGGLPHDRTLEILTHKHFFENYKAKGTKGQLDDFYWRGLATAFVKSFPESALALAEVMLKHFGDEKAITGDYSASTDQVLSNILRHFPKAVWELIKKHLQLPLDYRALRILDWLRGGEGEHLWPEIPNEAILEWIDDDVENRAPIFARYVSKSLDQAGLVHEVLFRYGAEQEVRRALTGNFWSEGWSGPASLHYQKRKDDVIKFGERETNANVRLWIEEYAAALDREIERSRIEEERRGF